jgi:hypothetical protein
MSEHDDLGMEILPVTDEQIRLCCLRLAAICAPPDDACHPTDMIKQAATFVRYVKDGTIPDPAMKIVGK